MIQILSVLFAFVVVVLGQLYLAPLLSFARIHPDFILVLLVYLAARKGRVWGISFGFAAGLLQDFTGAFSVLGANALAKSVAGYSLGTLNGTETVWTSRIVNIYIYGSIAGHALIYEIVMSRGLEESMATLLARILVQIFISSMLVMGTRFILPLLGDKI
ncbi:rod shape-determining protein MreD [Candidatus Neomarinimicrobiota bacterium]